ncbi:MAG TPA: phosphatase PAP2 family protein [Caldithrix abyssi]|uniref:Phosphatase PAP2 family protein n=1 Tax=Caldithrix abyssi TaxID=187145 RepID=A0A7V4U3B3_CALAY|nr:phosphatase PAP2 family protein [Caldithrix abyssi]
MKSKTTLRDPWIVIPAVLTTTFLLLVYVMDWNHPLFLYLNHISHYSGEALWANITILGDTLVTAVLILPLLKKRSEIIWTLLFAGVLALLVSQGLKTLLQMPRPPAVLDKNLFHIIGPALTQRSFPSGHTTTVFTVAFVLILYIRRNALRIFYFTTALVIGLSRIVVGVHWPLDILGGILTAVLSALVGLHLFNRVKERIPSVNPIYLSMIIMAAALVLLFFHNTRYPQAEVLQAVIAIFAITNTGFFMVKQLKG